MMAVAPAAILISLKKKKGKRIAEAWPCLTFLISSVSIKNCLPPEFWWHEENEHLSVEVTVFQSVYLNREQCLTNALF